MTQHEMLAILYSAQRAHLKPESEGGHGGPLEKTCFLQALALNARELHYPPGYLRNQFESKVPLLVGREWLIATEKCGRTLLELTAKGIGQLEAWNRNGCESHNRGRSGRTADSYQRRCIGKVLTDRDRPRRGGKAA
jgi:hypothetical protein